MLYYLALEPIPNRYNVDWNVWFPEMFEKYGIKYKVIEGNANVKRCDGKMYFDFRTSMMWKFEQLKKLLSCELRSNDVIFVPDIYYCGIEVLEFLRKLERKNIRIVSVIHAGSYIPYDYTYLNGLERICKDLEEVWLDICDLVFVATSYHKEKILECRNVDEDKIVVTGLPVDVEGLSKKYRIDECSRVRDFVYAGRLGIDKGYDVIKFIEKYFGISVYKTFEYDLSRDEYYKELAKSKCIIAPSRLETFGYAVVEAMILDLIPLVPDGLAFDDYVPRKFRYNQYDLYDLIDKVEFVMSYSGRIDMKKYVEKYQYQDVIGKMMKLIEKM